MTKSNTTNTIEERLRISLKLYRECQKRMISDSTMREIITIVEENSTIVREQRFLTIGRITDILQTSESEEMFLEKLRAEYSEQME